MLSRRGPREVRTPVAPSRPWLEWPLGLVLVGVLTGLAIISTGHWRKGSFAFGAAVVAGGLLRAVLPPRMAGLLVVRSRWFDAALTLLTGAAIMVLALIVPPEH
ncbi:MAG TPA: DUF3017 domain-containing protein [Propionibacteriaceae bacterium]|nr:DUF3017 domain-containing protein [Propionibacteriaceae bacterium]